MDWVPEDPMLADRVLRLMERFRDLHPDGEAVRDLLETDPGPTLDHLLELLSGDPEARAEDLAVQAWQALELEAEGADAEARTFLTRARELHPEGLEVQMLAAVLDLEGETRLARLQELEAAQRAALDDATRALMDKGEGVESLAVLRLHRSLAEQARVLIALEQYEACVTALDTLFSEAGADAFSLFPMLVQAALFTGDLETLDTWNEQLGPDYRGLHEWLEVYLAQTANLKGAAFQALRKARKAMPALELALTKAGDHVQRQLAQGGTPGGLEIPKDPRTAQVFMLLVSAFLADPDFMGWLRSQRALR
jgi:hypothetical protein